MKTAMLVTVMNDRKVYLSADPITCDCTDWEFWGEIVKAKLYSTNQALHLKRYYEASKKIELLIEYVSERQLKSYRVYFKRYTGYDLHPGEEPMEDRMTMAYDESDAISQVANIPGIQQIVVDHVERNFHCGNPETCVVCKS